MPDPQAPCAARRDRRGDDAGDGRGRSPRRRRPRAGTAAGDAIEEGETLVEVSTDKVDAEVPATASGTVTELLVEPDDVVKVGQALARIEVGAAPGASAAPSEALNFVRQRHRCRGHEIDSGRRGFRWRSASPPPRASTFQVEGLGPGGKVMKADVLAAAGVQRRRPDAER
ncbi:MAG: biotin/lipoyl-binding protein [Solirubrobacterales bacterium]|nr:biotin/lipoyl-binding protein [Solirubrobacterales bacterium]